ncbi:MAG TPA: hypothetical protein RMH26_16900, partial [Polyangiaceae bacterium LLY-WYZ-15_(1-7)]|nr:hypothetical protein [Polyangiaceae bacterium LLY-WYZ-15_(1-7)]
MPLLELTDRGLYCPAGGFHVDPWGEVDLALLTHAHGDHARPGSARYLAAAPGAAILEKRLAPPAGELALDTLPYGARQRLG